MKECSICHVEKDSTEFSPDRRVRSGLQACCKSCDRKKKNKSYRDNRDKILSAARRKRLWYGFKLTEEEFDEILFSQGGGCAIFGGETNLDRSLCVDHDRKCCPGTRSCGKCVRGILCTRCNTAIGSLREDVDLFFKAINYIRSWKNE